MEGADPVCVRPAREDEVEELAAICMESFNAMDASVGIEPEFDEPPVATLRAKMGCFNSSSEVLVAECCGRVVGSAGVACYDDVVGVGPVSVRTDCADRGIGRKLMQAVARWAADRSASSIRLTQLASNVKSFSLYATLGYEAKLQLAMLKGRVHCDSPAISVRPAGAEDAEQCAQLYTRVTSETRNAEIARSLSSPAAARLLCAIGEGGELVGYTTGFALPGHTVALTASAFFSLLSAASGAAAGGPRDQAGEPPLVMLPVQLYPDLLRRCLEKGQRTAQLRTLMAQGPFGLGGLPGSGIYIPSIAF